MLGTTDPRDHELARILIRHSTEAKPGQMVFIQCFGRDTLRLGAACAEEAIKAGAAPFVNLVEPEIQRAVLRKGTAGVFKRLGQFELKQMKDADCYIAIRGTDNAFELSDVPRKQLDLHAKNGGKAVMEYRVNKTRWVVLRYPNSSMAQMAQTSTAAFGDFYYRVCCVDYAKMRRAVQPLRQLMDRTREVRVKGPGTDLSFTKRGIKSIPCAGECNIPDGECFTAPEKTSVSGTVQFNTPTIWEGAPYENIFLSFENGKVVEARGADNGQTKRLNKVLDQDAGARYVGEWSLGFHPHILEPMRDILFDEKIAGSFHMALGRCYEMADNGNKSALHWDMVCIQRPDYGGGEVYFDGKLIRKNGLFVTRELKGLNPQNYK
ncbi:MAG: aminopeptidase [Candidatus Sumerlaeaceae bacterium]|nr:aminopeptidase [Candidatus Sumerlaeaceae bacterium]